MLRVRCQLCGEFIGQRDRIVRIFAEAVEKRDGDLSSPLRWTRVLGMPEVVVVHFGCVSDELSVRMPCPAGCLRILDDSSSSEKPRGPHLFVVKP